VSVFGQRCVSKLHADDLKLYMRMSIAGCTHAAFNQNQNQNVNV